MNFVLKLFFLLIPIGVFGQQSSNWMDLEIQKKWHNWTFAINQEYRSAQQFDQFEATYSTLEAEIKLTKEIKLGANGQFIHVFDDDQLIHNKRYRFSAFGTYSKKIGRFELGIKQRFQILFKDESIHTYKNNPLKKWRSRLDIDYDIRNLKWTPFYALESFFKITNTQTVFEKLRHKFGFTYKINKLNQIKLYGIFESENQISRKIAGISYRIKFD